jgi:hypothetical protein
MQTQSQEIPIIIIIFINFLTLHPIFLPRPADFCHFQL